MAKCLTCEQDVRPEEDSYIQYMDFQMNRVHVDCPEKQDSVSASEVAELLNEVNHEQRH